MQPRDREYTYIGLEFRLSDKSNVREWEELLCRDVHLDLFLKNLKIETLLHRVRLPNWSPLRRVPGEVDVMLYR